MMGKRQDVATVAGVKVQQRVRKWENGRTPVDGEPDEVLVLEHWQDMQGNRITDPDTIARLEASVAVEEAANGSGESSA